MIHLTKLDSGELSKKETLAVFHLKLALRNMVTAIKLQSELAENLKMAFDSPQKDFQEMYFEMSRVLLKTLRFAAQLKSDSAQLDELQAYKRRIEKFVGVFYARMQEMIKNQRLSNAQTGSLMNDIHSIRLICNHLIDAISLLYTNEDISEEHLNF